MQGKKSHQRQLQTPRKPLRNIPKWKDEIEGGKKPLKRDMVRKGLPTPRLWVEEEDSPGHLQQGRPPEAQTHTTRMAQQLPSWEFSLSSVCPPGTWQKLKGGALNRGLKESPQTLVINIFSVKYKVSWYGLATQYTQAKTPGLPFH